MPRKRMIDPEYWSDEEVGKWSRSARLFYIGLWNFSDDCGRFKAHSGLLKSQIFPYDDPKSLKIEKLKEEVSNKIVWYEVNGSQYGYLRNFNKHQRIDKPQPSKIPPPPEDKIAEHSSNIPRLVPPNIREVNIIEENIKETPTSSTLQVALKEVSNEGLNIYSLINRLKKQLGWAKNQQFPEAVLLKVCQSYKQNKQDIKEPWAWFCVTIKKVSGEYFAQKNIQEGQEWKQTKMAQSVKDILGIK